MADLTNGTSTPAAHPADADPEPSPASTSSSALKRKREDDSNAHEQADGQPSRSKQIQLDILDLLQLNDTAPSFLKHEISAHAVEPSSKKARLANNAAKITILEKLAAGEYSSLGALSEDAARVSKDIESGLRAKTRDGEAKDGGRLAVEDLKQIQRVKAFEEFVKEAVEKQRQRYAAYKKEMPKGEDVAGTANGHTANATAGANGRAGTVLTLFGNAPTPKQLFSSMQNAPGTKQEPLIKTELPVEEMSLPNGLTATKIMPAPLGETKKGPTIEEAFPPPFNLPALHPPKAHKRSYTRDTKVTWEFKDPVTRGSKKGGYTVQSLPSGDWLGYGGIDSGSESASAKEKRKQRDRALSSGAEVAKDPPSETALAEEQVRQEEAMFRRAYSSFAPSHDDSKSIIPAETKSMIWWHKAGEQKFNETFAIDPALVDEQPPTALGSKSGVEADAGNEEDLGNVVESLNALDEDMADIEQPTAKTDIEHVLREISHLLETLASHQRIRNATLSTSATASRTPISPAPVLAAKIGKPDEPAEDEVSTYHTLRHELAYLILKLPPYAVAKLDGDQLSELGVSKLIPIQGKDVKGIMEEDYVARLAKHTAMATAAGVASLNRSTSSTSGQHYSSTSQRTPAIGQAANTRYGSSSGYGASRTPAPAPQYQRSTSNQSTYSTPAVGTRPGYSTQANQYTRPAQQSSYSTANGGQYYQQPRPTPSAGYGGYGNTNQSFTSQTPSTQQQQARTYTPSSSVPLQQFQQRAHTAAANAVAYQQNGAGAQQQQQQQRTASPANVQPRPVYPAPQQQYSGQHQGPTSGRATPTGYAVGSGPQTPVNGAGYARPPQPQVVKAGGTPQP